MKKNIVKSKIVFIVSILLFSVLCFGATGADLTWVLPWDKWNMIKEGITTEQDSLLNMYYINIEDDGQIIFGTGLDAKLIWETVDDSSNCFYLILPDVSDTTVVPINVPVFIVGDQAMLGGVDWGSYFYRHPFPHYGVANAGKGFFFTINDSGLFDAALVSYTTGIDYPLFGGDSTKVRFYKNVEFADTVKFYEITEFRADIKFDNNEHNIGTIALPFDTGYGRTLYISNRIRPGNPRGSDLGASIDTMFNAVFADHYRTKTLEDTVVIIGTPTDGLRLMIDSSGTIRSDGGLAFAGDLIIDDIQADSIYALEIVIVTDELYPFKSGTATDAN
ncbi:MAG: hypothetical protein H8D45_26730, partial [Bacteroidetes bacterium]|nr:hypothetical protein [Bacteroidota bacterium]